MLLIISILIIVPLSILYIWKDETKPFLIEVKSGRIGTITFDNEEINLAYSHYDLEKGNQIGWTSIITKKSGIKLQNYFDHRRGGERRIGSFSKVVGIPGHDGWNYIFANGIDGFFDPGVIGQRTRDFKDWIPIPTFNFETSSSIFSYFSGYDFNSTDSLYCCFSDYQGLIMGQTNYSFYLFQITDDQWDISKITFQGNLEYYIKSIYQIFQDRNVILWNYYNSSKDLIELNLTKQNDNDIWLNYTISLPQEDLTPIGFEKSDQDLRFFFYGLNYYGESNTSNYKITNIYCADIKGNQTEYSLIASYPNRIYIKEGNIYNWGNGSYSIFFNEYENYSISSYYALINEGNIIKEKVQYNESSTNFLTQQMTIKDNYVYLVWTEIITEDIEDLYYLYVLRFHANSSFKSALEANKQIVEWNEDINTTMFQLIATIPVVLLIRKKKRKF